MYVSRRVLIWTYGWTAVAANQIDSASDAPHMRRIDRRAPGTHVTQPQGSSSKIIYTTNTDFCLVLLQSSLYVDFSAPPMSVMIALIIVFPLCNYLPLIESYCNNLYL